MKIPKFLYDSFIGVTIQYVLLLYCAQNEIFTWPIQGIAFTVSAFLYGSKVVDNIIAIWRDFWGVDK